LQGRKAVIFFLFSAKREARSEVKKKKKRKKNPATHSGCKLLLAINLSTFNVAEIVIGKASFKLIGKPLLREALRLTIF